MRQAGFAEVDLIVHHAGQQVQSLGRDSFVDVRPQPGRRIDGDDFVVLDQHVGYRFARGQNASRAGNQNTVGHELDVGCRLCVAGWKFTHDTIVNYHFHFPTSKPQPTTYIDLRKYSSNAASSGSIVYF